MDDDPTIRQWPEPSHHRSVVKAKTEPVVRTLPNRLSGLCGQANAHSTPTRGVTVPCRFGSGDLGRVVHSFGQTFQVLGGDYTIALNRARASSDRIDESVFEVRIDISVCFTAVT